MKTLLQCQETMTIQHETYQINSPIKIIINSLGQIYQDKETQAFLNKLILQKNGRR